MMKPLSRQTETRQNTPAATFWLSSVLLLLLWGCAPPEGQRASGSPTPAQVTPSPLMELASPSPSPTEKVAVAASPLPQPDLPEKLLKSYASAPLDPKIKDSETWWADSGINDNRLGYYTSQEASGEIEAKLVPIFTGGHNKPYLEGIGPVFDYDGNRVCIVKREKDEAMFVIAPLGPDKKIPQILLSLKLPPIAPEELEGKSTLVVLATGQGLGEHMDHMLGQAGLVITPTPTEK
ncbi:hypothetical protein JST97_16045 [bacterium]|nr:hypothetical protein [bacterium]